MGGFTNKGSRDVPTSMPQSKEYQEGYDRIWGRETNEASVEHRTPKEITEMSWRERLRGLSQ